MILAWGVPGDEPFDAVCAALRHVHADLQVVDQRQAAQMRAMLDVAPGGALSGRLVTPDGDIDLAQVGSAYIRPFETSKLNAGLSPGEQALSRAVAVDAALISWADLSQAAVVNRPSHMAANNSKPYQLALIAGFGFAVPDTLVTTDEHAVRRFMDGHGEIIYKSVSGVRSIVSRLDEARYNSLVDVANCPTQFQEYIPGTDIRVHVAGDAVIATEIASAADDYRYAALSDAALHMVPVDLPRDVADKCRSMVRGMGLYLAGIDLRRTPAGKWICFEVNPSPAFTFFEAATGQPIAAAVADLLVQLARRIH